MAVGTIPGTEISCRRRSPHHPFRGKPLVNRFPRRILSHTRLGRGTVFKLDNTGAGFATLYSFTAAPDFPYTNSDRASPKAGLILSGNTLYGTAYQGGVSGYGPVFSNIIPPQLTMT